MTKGHQGITFQGNDSIKFNLCYNNILREDLTYFEKCLSLLLSMLYIVALFFAIKISYKIFKSTELHSLYKITAILLLAALSINIIALLDPINTFLFEINLLIPFYDKNYILPYELWISLRCIYFTFQALMCFTISIIWIRISNFLEEVVWKKRLEGLFICLFLIYSVTNIILICCSVYTWNFKNELFVIDNDISVFLIGVPAFTNIIAGFVISKTIKHYFIYHYYYRFNLIIFGLCFSFLLKGIEIGLTILFMDNFLAERFNCCVTNDILWSSVYWGVNSF